MIRYGLFAMVIGLTGCKTLSSTVPDDEPVTSAAASGQSESACVFLVTPQDDARCQWRFWLDYWVAVDKVSWPERQALIESLTHSADHVLQKIILSQPVNTPYKARLRAQHWLEQIAPQLSNPIQQWLTVMVNKPSGHMLELESAVTILSNMNNQQQRIVNKQEQQIQSLNAQLEALMKIESNLMLQEDNEQ